MDSQNAHIISILVYRRNPQNGSSENIFGNLLMKTELLYTIYSKMPQNKF